MIEKQDTDKNKLVNSYFMLRTIIGILGVLLPIILVIIHGDILPSISLYYYSKSSIFFISILVTYGLLLITYKGYEKTQDEKISDNKLTHFGGFMILIVVFVPTYCRLEFCNICFDKNFPLFSHNSDIFQIIHLFAAFFFFISMGIMSYYKFSRGNNDKYNNSIYKVIGLIIGVSVIILIIKFFIIVILDKNFNYFKNDTFVFESIAIMAFGISWIIKSNTIKMGYDKLFGTIKSKSNVN